MQRKDEDRHGWCNFRQVDLPGRSYLPRALSGSNRYLLSTGTLLRRQSAKGIPVKEAFKQLICFFVDGTNLHLTYFDELKKEVGYAKTIETSPGDMASSYQVNRFLKKFSYLRNYLFRRLLQAFFIWRLKVVKPEVILLDLDTIVMDNDTAKKREGVNPTYKNVKRFQPLQLKWGPYFVDAVFRGGSKHSHHGNTVITMVEHVVEKIRDEYNKEVPIVVTAYIGFFDQVNFRYFEEMGIGYKIGGKLYPDIEERAKETPERNWSYLSKEGGRVYKLLSFIKDEEIGRDHAERFIPAWSMKETSDPSALPNTERSITPTWVRAKKSIHC